MHHHTTIYTQTITLVHLSTNSNASTCQQLQLLYIRKIPSGKLCIYLKKKYMINFLTQSIFKHPSKKVVLKSETDLSEEKILKANNFGNNPLNWEINIFITRLYMFNRISITTRVKWQKKNLLKRFWKISCLADSNVLSEENKIHLISVHDFTDNGCPFVLFITFTL